MNEDLFVGRERELAALHAGLGEAMAARGRLRMLVGAAGIGKTRLAQEIAAEARQLQASVSWGRCWEGDGAPAFWPWVQILRSCMGELGDDALAVAMGPGAADVAQIVGEVGERLPNLTASPTLEASQARFRLFDSVGAFLRRMSKDRPLLLILDDLHWADSASVELLRFVARELHDCRLLLLGTYRSDELRRDEPLAESLAALARDAERIELSGLPDPAVARVIASRTGVQPPSTLVEAIQQRTAGNPFYIHELIHLLRSEGDLAADADGVAALSVPRGVRDTIRRRLQRVSQGCRDLLNAGSVIGQTFEVTLAADALEGESRAGALELADEAVAAGILNPPQRSIDPHSFAHALIRDTIYEELGTRRRLELHRRIAGVLLDHPARDAATHYAELAHHFFQAVPAGEAERAIVYSIKAGEQAASRLAYEEAVDHYGRALEVLQRVPAADVRQECDLLLALGVASMQAGDEERMLRVVPRAVELARSARLSEHLSRAALLFASNSTAGSGHGETIALVEEALAALDPRPSPLRARLLGQLAEVLPFDPRQQRRQSLCNEAVEVARLVGEPRALANALVSWHWTLWAPDNPRERAAVAVEVKGLGSESDGWAMSHGHMLLACDLLELGDRGGFDAGTDACERRARELRDPWGLLLTQLCRALQHFLAGRFATAEELAMQALIGGQRAFSAQATQYVGAQLFALRREQGRLAELEAAARAMVAQHPANTGWRAALAFLFAETGRTDEARAELERLADDDFAGLPRDQNWLMAVAFLSQVSAVLGDTRRAAILYDLLRPFADRIVVVAPGIACTGAAAHCLGVLAATLGRWDEAEEHFENALAINTRIGIVPFIAHTRREHAAMLVRRNRPQDIAAARPLREAAAATYESLGMESFTAAIERLRAGIEARPGAAGGEAEIVGAEAPPNEFRSNGDYWTVRYAGATVQLKDVKGLRYVASLLRERGRSLHVFDLLSMVDGPSPQPPSRAKLPARLEDEGLTTDAPGAVRTSGDARALAEYRRRLDEVRAELAEAEELNDAGRASRLRADATFLTAELGAAYGLGGSRHSAEPVEKARKAVTNRIRASVRHLEAVHGALGRHLSASLKLGTFCRYDPPEPIDWRIG